MSADQAALAHGLACDHECLMSWSPRARPQAPSPGAGKNPIPRPSPARGSTSTNRLPAPPSKSRPGARGHARPTPSSATWANQAARAPGRLRRSLQHRNDPFRRLQLRNPRTRESAPLFRWHGTHGITERRRAPANRNCGRSIWTSLLVRCDCVPDTTLLALTRNGEILEKLPGFGSADRRATCAEKSRGRTPCS